LSKDRLSHHKHKAAKCSKPGLITEVWLDVTRIDFCNERKCVTVGGERSVDLVEVANGNIEALGEVVIPDNDSDIWPATLRLLLGSDNYISANGVTHKLHVPGAHRFGIKLKGNLPKQPGLLSEILLDFDPDQHIRFLREFAIFTHRNVKVKEAKTVPFEGVIKVGHPGKGTTLSLADRFELYVPHGAMNTPTALWVRETEGSGLTPVYTVGPGGTQLLKSAEVRIRYRPEIIPPGYPEEDLVVLHDGKPLPTEVKTAELLLEAKISHLSTLRGSAIAQTAEEVIPGVEYIDRTMEEIPVHVVLVDRDLTDYEWRILADERISGDDVNLQTVEHLANTNRPQAIVAINGYWWEGDRGDEPGQTGNFATTTIIDGVIEHIDTGSSESIMGFGQQDGFGIKIQRMTEDEYNAGMYSDYRHNLFGSHTSILRNGECFGEGNTSFWSAIGYSETQVVLVASDMSTLFSRVNDEELCNIFRDYGVTDAVRLDGGPSTSLVIDGTHINPISAFPLKQTYGSARHVAYAVGLVPVEPEVPLEILSIPSDGTVITSQRSYSSSLDYRVEVSGTYVWGGCDPVNCPDGNLCNYIRYGDAEWLTDDCWDSHYNLFQGWDISVFINDTDVNWGAYTENHKYSTVRRGNNGPFTFRIEDCPPCYVDNSGSLTVRIFPAP
jgi:hypothetical protein